MQKVFIYGDSNVWGDTIYGPRVPYHLRWANRLRRLIKASILVDGIPGRVAGDYRTDKPDKNGKTSYLSSLDKAGSVDLVIIALGTNDLQQKYGRTAQEIIDDLLWYRTVTQGPELLYILPPIFDTGEQSGPSFTQDSLSLRREVIRRKNLLGWTLLLEEIPLSDGIHFSTEGHKIVALLTKQVIEEGV